MAFFGWIDEPLQDDTDILMKRIQIEAAWYYTYYKWSGNADIRSFELIRTKRSLGRLCTLYWIAKRRKVRNLQ